jgi:hypothetical protein
MQKNGFHLISFASSDMKKSLNRLSKQAKKFEFFDTIQMYNDTDLERDFRENFSQFLHIGSRGYGYWIWKPTIILKGLSKLKAGESLLYVDAGCHLNVRGKMRMLDYVRFLDTSEIGILAFQNKNPEAPFNYDGRELLNLPDGDWIKGDLLDYFDVRYASKITKTQTIGAGIILVKNIPKAVSFLEDWEEHMQNNLHLLDDTPSKSPNLVGFCEHRHDQAFFSIMAKNARIPTISSSEYWYPKKNSLEPDWEALCDFPIHARRDKKLSMRSKIVRKIQRIHKKFQ